MTDWHLAQGDYSDWIQAAVFLVVVVLAALGNLTKVLIRKFGQQDKDDRSERPGREVAGPRPPAPPPQARPLPPRPMSRTSPPRAEVQTPGPPEPPKRRRTYDVDNLPDFLREVFHQLKEKQQPKPPPRPSPPARPEPISAAPPPPAPPRPRRWTAAKTQRRAKPRRAPGTFIATVEDRRFRDLPSAERHHGMIALEDEDAAAPIEPDVVRNPSRKDLRHAIILSEVLAKPIALREPDQRWAG